MFIGSILFLSGFIGGAFFLKWRVVLKHRVEKLVGLKKEREGQRHIQRVNYETSLHLRQEDVRLNGHTLIAGPAGNGKTIFVQAVIANHFLFEKEAEFLIFDTLNEYRNVTRVLGGLSFQIAGLRNKSEDAAAAPVEIAGGRQLIERPGLVDGCRVVNLYTEGCTDEELNDALPVFETVLRHKLQERHGRLFVIIDNFAWTINSPGWAALLTRLLRFGPEERVGVVTVAQSPDEYLRLSVGREMVEKAQCKVIGCGGVMQTEPWMGIGLNEEDLDILRFGYESVEPRRDGCRNFLLKSGVETKLVTIKLSPFELWTFGARFPLGVKS